MKKQYLPILFLLISFSSLTGQNHFTKIIANAGDAYLGDCVMSSDSALIALSNAWPYPNPTLFKIDAAGSMEWSYKIQTSYTYLSTLCKLNHTIYTAGFQGSSAHGYLVAWNEQGQITWSKSLSGDSSQYTVVSGITSDGNGLYMLLSLRDSNSLFYYPAVCYMDTLGNILWSKKYHHPNVKPGRICYNPVRNELVFMSNEGDRNYFTCIDSAGDVRWIKTIYSTRLHFQKIAPDRSGSGYLVGGRDSGFYSTLMKLDALDGSTQWARKYKSNGLYYPGGITVLSTPASGGILMGSSEFVKTSLFFLSDSGTVIRTNQYFGPSYVYDPANSIRGIFPTASGDLKIAGDFVNGQYLKMFFLSADSLGRTGCETSFTILDSLFSITDTMISDPARNLTLTITNASQTIASYTYNLSTTCLTSVDESAEETIKLSVFPNPASSLAAFQFEGEPELRTIRVFDSFGREMINFQTRDKRAEISVADFPAGIYLYRVEAKGKNSISGKLFVE